MPIYEFHCRECRKEFKALRRLEESDSVQCPTCGTGKVARLLSVTAAQTQSNGDLNACGLPMGGGCCGMNPNGCGR